MKNGEMRRVTDVTNRAFFVPFDPHGYKPKYKELYGKLEKDVSENEVKVIVAVINNKIIGAQRYKFLSDLTINISRLVVLKRYRKNGIAYKLIQEIEKIARRKRYEKITLDCMLEKNLPPYYERIGFKIDKIKKHGDHHDVFMSKRIS